VKLPGAIGLVSAALLAAACRTPTGAVEIPQEDLPVSLARTPGEPSPDARSDRFGVVYFVQGRRLQPATRSLSPGDPVTAAVQALLAGPTDEERRRGFSTAVPDGTSLLQAEVFDQIAEVDLSAEFQGPADPEEITLRIAQVVWTTVAIPGVTAIRFAIDGVPAGVPTDEQVSVERPVSAPDYAGVAPEPIAAPPPQAVG
jgi:germination protein M